MIRPGTIEEYVDSFAMLGKRLRASKVFDDDNQTILKRYLEYAEILYAAIEDPVAHGLQKSEDGHYTLMHREGEALLTPSRLLAELRTTLLAVLEWQDLPSQHAELVINSLDYWELRQQIRLSRSVRQSIAVLVEEATIRAIKAQVPDMVRKGTEVALADARRWRRGSVIIAATMTMFMMLLAVAMGSYLYRMGKRNHDRLHSLNKEVAKALEHAKKKQQETFGHYYNTSKNKIDRLKKEVTQAQEELNASIATLKKANGATRQGLSIRLDQLEKGTATKKRLQRVEQKLTKQEEELSKQKKEDDTLRSQIASSKTERDKAIKDLDQRFYPKKEVDRRIKLGDDRTREKLVEEDVKPIKDRQQEHAALLKNIEDKLNNHKKLVHHSDTAATTAATANMPEPINVTASSSAPGPAHHE